MALTTPVVSDIAPFDATIGTTVSFSYNSNVKYAVYIQINKVDDETTVYSHLGDNGYRKKCEIPAGILENGVKYSFKMRIVSADQTDASALSRSVIFICVAAPVFEFMDMPANNKIETSFVYAKINYQSTNPNGYSEPLNVLTINLYKAGNNTLVESSGRIYGTTAWEYNFLNLENGVQYRLEAIGETANGLIVTAEEKFYCEYIAPATVSTIRAVNNWIDASITVSSNIIVIEGKYDGEPEYVMDMAVNLRDGKPVVYDEGFCAGGDYTIQMTAGYANPGAKILSTNDGEISLYFMEDKSYYAQKREWYETKPWLLDGAEYTTEQEWFDNNKPLYYIHLTSANYAYVYEVDSEKVDLSDAYSSLIILRRKNGIYSVELMPNNTDI